MRLAVLLALVGCAANQRHKDELGDAESVPAPLPGKAGEPDAALPATPGAPATGLDAVSRQRPPANNSFTRRLEIGGSESWPAAQTEYPIEITLHAGAGSDSGKDVYLGNDARPDFGDVRFADEKGTPLEHWLESASAGTAAVWVKVPVIARTGGTRIALSWGDRDAMSASDGKGTFRFFD